MPRSARLDIPNLLQHVMVRGIEHCDIFRGDDDRRRFVERLSGLLTETDTQCYAWSLMTNHFHLLLKPASQPLAVLMRRLLTGYAVVFNKMHTRSGHLFQNRYKSIVCNEETYLMELVRYIHLNPLRAGLVANMDELDRYPWCGHAVLMGKRPMAGQETREVLVRFGASTAQARRRYRSFVEDGIVMGQRSDLMGGGRRRNQGEAADAPEEESFDDRILGHGEFVDALRRQMELSGIDTIRLSLPALADYVCDEMGVDKTAIRHPSKARRLAEARGVICFLAVRELGYKGIEVGRLLHLGPTGVSLAVRRGECIVRENPSFLKCIHPELEK